MSIMTRYLLSGSLILPINSWTRVHIDIGIRICQSHFGEGAKSVFFYISVNSLGETWNVVAFSMACIYSFTHLAGAAQEETAIALVWINGIGSETVNTDCGVAFWVIRASRRGFLIFSPQFLCLCVNLWVMRDPFYIQVLVSPKVSFFSFHFCAISSQSVCDLCGFHPEFWPSPLFINEPISPFLLNSPLPFDFSLPDFLPITNYRVFQKL